MQAENCTHIASQKDAPPFCRLSPGINAPDAAGAVSPPRFPVPRFSCTPLFLPSPQIKTNNAAGQVGHPSGGRWAWTLSHCAFVGHFFSPPLFMSACARGIVGSDARLRVVATSSSSSSSSSLWPSQSSSRPVMSLPFYFIYLSALCFRRQTATAVENSLLHFKFKLNNDLSAPRGFVSTQVQRVVELSDPPMG